MLYSVYVYCPVCETFTEFPVDIEAPTEELAKKKIIGMEVTCPKGHTFKIEPIFITRIYPKKPIPTPPYKLMPEESVKEADWLRGAIVEEPLPLGAHPKGSPKLATIIKNALTTLIYEQPIESRAIRFKEYYAPFTIKIRGKEVKYGPFKTGDVVVLPIETAKKIVAAGFAEWAYPYPEYKWSIKYPRHVFTKFFEEARRMSKAGKICEAAYYLIQHCPGVTVRMVADVLERGYWTIYRCIAGMIHPGELKKFSEEVKEQAKLEKWSPSELSETEKAISQLRYVFEKEKKPSKPPKVLLGRKWRGQYTLYPVIHKTEDELLAELKRILTLEGYPKMTPEEEEEMRKQLHRYEEEKLKESIMYWLSKE